MGKARPEWTAYQDIIDAHGDKINANSSMQTHGLRNLEFGTNAVSAAHEHGILVVERLEVKEAYRRDMATSHTKWGKMGAMYCIACMHHTAKSAKCSVAPCSRCGLCKWLDEVNLGISVTCTR